VEERASRLTGDRGELVVSGHLLDEQVLQHAGQRREPREAAVFVRLDLHELEAAEDDEVRPERVQRLLELLQHRQTRVVNVVVQVVSVRARGLVTAEHVTLGVLEHEVHILLLVALKVAHKLDVGVEVLAHLLADGCAEQHLAALDGGAVRHGCGVATHLALDARDLVGELDHLAELLGRRHALLGRRAVREVKREALLQIAQRPDALVVLACQSLFIHAVVVLLLVLLRLLLLLAMQRELLLLDALHAAHKLDRGHRHVQVGAAAEREPWDRVPGLLLLAVRLLRVQHERRDHLRLLVRRQRTRRRRQQRREEVRVQHRDRTDGERRAQRQQLTRAVHAGDL